MTKEKCLLFPGLILAVLIAAIIPNSIEAENPVKGEWTGWIIIDSWGDMYLYNYCYVYPMDKILIPKLKEYDGKPVVLNVKKTIQINDAGPIRIAEAEYVKEADLGELKALSLAIDPNIFKRKDNVIPISFTVRNDSKESIRFVPAQLTLIIIKERKKSLPIEIYGDSYPIREGSYIRKDEVVTETGRIKMQTDSTYETLEPGEEYSVTIMQELLPGKYYIFAGYGMKDTVGTIALKSNASSVYLGEKKKTSEYESVYDIPRKKEQLPKSGMFHEHPKDKNLKYYSIERYKRDQTEKDPLKPGGIYSSKDGGLTWFLICSKFDFQKVFIHPETGKLYAIIQDQWIKEDKEGYLNLAMADKALMSEDGKRWKDITGGDGHILTIANIIADPDNPGRVCLIANVIRGYVLQSVDDNYSKWTWYRAWDWDKRKDEKTSRFTK